MADSFNSTPVEGVNSSDGQVAGDRAVETLPAISTALAPDLTEGHSVALSVDLDGNLRVSIAGGGSTEVTGDVAVVNGTTPLEVELSATALAALETTELGATTLAALETIELGATTLAALETIDLGATSLAALETTELGATTLAALESVDLNAATLTALEKTTPQVRGADVSDANPLPVLMQTSVGTLLDTPFVSVDLAAGASVEFEDAALSGVVGRLVEFTADSSVRIKAELFTVTAGDVATSRRVFFSDPTAAGVTYRSPDPDTIIAPDGGVFRLTITNLDTANAANVYGSITRTES